MTNVGTGKELSVELYEKIPKDIIKRLSEHEIKEEDILAFSMSDMTLFGEFAKGCVVLTKETLYVYQGQPDASEVMSFKGIGSKKDKLLWDAEEWEEKSYPIKEHSTDENPTDGNPTNENPINGIEKLEVLRTVGGGILYAVNPDRQLTAFTNLYMGDMLQLAKLFGKLREKGELSEEDLKKEDKEEYCPKCGTMYPDKERKICPKCMNRKSIFLRTLAYFKRYVPKLVVMFFCYIGSALLNLVWPYFSGTVLYDKVLSQNEEFLELIGHPGMRFVVLLFWIVLIMVVSKILLQAFGIIQGVLTAKIVPYVVRDMKTSVFDSLGKLSVSFYSSRQTGGLMTRVLGDAERVTGFFIDGLPYLFINVFTIVCSVVVMFQMNARMALVGVIIVPIIFTVSFRMMPRLWQFYGRRHRAERSMNSRLNDNLTGARVVKAFGQQSSEMGRFGKSNVRIREAEMALVGYDNRFYALYVTFENLASLLIYSLGAYLILTTESMELGVLITFTGYLNQMNGPLDFISYVFRWFADSMNSAQRMFEIIDAVPEITEAPDAIHPQKVDGTIELTDVTFGYELHKPVLKNISMKIESGKMLGIVGRSGAGKSTLVNLISRLYDPQEGKITLDGIDVKKLGFRALRKNVAMVSQETYIFMGTVAENIAYANPDASRDEIINAAVLASAHDFICKMPDGYDTVIGAAGRNLSGGERQRISIARAILANPRILILDEATASVDTETEKAIQSSINLLIKDRTTISIAHRLSTLRDADYLVVIDNGEITERGTHDELLAQKGTYYKLKELQTKALALKGLE